MIFVCGLGIVYLVLPPALIWSSLGQRDEGSGRAAWCQVRQAATLKTVGGRGILENTRLSPPLQEAATTQPQSLSCQSCQESRLCSLTSGHNVESLQSAMVGVFTLGQELQIRACLVFPPSRASCYHLPACTGSWWLLLQGNMGLDLLNFLILQDKLNPGFLCKMYWFLKFHVSQTVISLRRSDLWVSI